MRTTTPATHTITLLILTTLVAVCVWLGPPVYRVLQIAGTGVLAIAVVTVTALVAVTLLRDLLADDE